MKLYAIKNTETQCLEDDGMGLTVYWTDRAVVEAHIKASKGPYEVSEETSLTTYALINDCVSVEPGVSLERGISRALAEYPEDADKINAILAAEGGGVTAPSTAKKKPSTYQDDIDAALEEMVRLILDEEWEFPDAAYHVARSYNVHQGMLEAAYDIR